MSELDRIRELRLQSDKLRSDKDDFVEVKNNEIESIEEEYYAAIELLQNEISEIESRLFEVEKEKVLNALHKLYLEKIKVRSAEYFITEIFPYLTLESWTGQFNDIFVSYDDFSSHYIVTFSYLRCYDQYRYENTYYKIMLEDDVLYRIAWYDDLDTFHKKTEITEFPSAFKVVCDVSHMLR